MSLVSCPNCNKEVSDKATTCPACGYELGSSPTSPLICRECKAALSPEDKFCPNCGCPTEITEAQPKTETIGINQEKPKKNKKKSIIITALILVVLIIAGAVFSSYYSKQKKLKEYQTNLSLVTATMLNGAVSAEKAGNLIHNVWYNTIWEKSDSTTDKYTKSSGYGFNDDFNDSLSALFADSTFTSQISEIKTNNDLVNSLMKSLANPPEEYSEAYSAVKDLYDAYLDITNCATNPTGSLTSYTSTFNEADSDFLNAYNAMEIYTD